MVDISSHDKEKLLNSLTRSQIIANEDGRKAILIKANLEQLLPHLELNGPSAIRIPLIIEHLSSYGKINDDQEALGCFLNAMKDFVGKEDREMLDYLIEKYRLSHSEPNPVQKSFSKIQSISWLHLTDLHCGLKGQKFLWPNVRERFFEDIDSLHEKSGPWDLILFTGDLTQKGTTEEFVLLTDILQRLSDHLTAIGSKPVLLAVPGNHDLMRPDPVLPVVKALNYWHIDEVIRNSFWEDEKGEYRLLVKTIFQPFTDWFNEWKKEHPIPHYCVMKDGIIPGDFSVTFEKKGLKLGIVGLNSTFLQLTAKDYTEQLETDVRQLHHVCNEDIPDWINQHHVTLLMTHHPPAWLHKKSQDNFKAEITPPGRFMVHLFGHMHEPYFVSTQVGGSKTQREYQGTSLFGLESWVDKKQKRQERIHGYSAGCVKVNEDEGELVIWPRRLIKQSAGHWKIVPDFEHDLNDDNAIISKFTSRILK